MDQNNLKNNPNILLAVLFLILIPISIQESFACSCSAYPDFLMAWMESTGAFQGTVKHIPAGEGPRKVTFDIHQIQKGNYPYGNYTLVDSSIIYHDKDMIQMSSCSVDYKIGETYQVFTYGGIQMTGETNMCSTKQISGFDEGSHEDEDGQIQYYRQDYNFFVQYNLISLILPMSVTVIIVGIIIWRKRK